MRAIDAIEREAEQVADRELRRRRALLASLSTADRRAVDVVAHRLALRVACCLADEARRDERLARALTPDR